MSNSENRPGQKPSNRVALAYDFSRFVRRPLIDEALNGTRAQSYKPAVVSTAMRQTPFVRQLEAALGSRLTYDLSQGFRPGVIRANTLAEGGYSLRVYSSVAKERSLSVCNITGGRPLVWFSSRAKFRKYLPRHHAAVDRLVALVERMGGDMVAIAETGKASVAVETATSHVNELATIVRELA